MIVFTTISIYLEDLKECIGRVVMKGDINYH